MNFLPLVRFWAISSATFLVFFSPVGSRMGLFSRVRRWFSQGVPWGVRLSMTDREFVQSLHRYARVQEMFLSGMPGGGKSRWNCIKLTTDSLSCSLDWLINMDSSDRGLLQPCILNKRVIYGSASPLRDYSIHTYIHKFSMYVMLCIISISVCK